MRVSPELNLKRSIAGGFRRLCEIGKCYRNEGMDLTHLPELTMCEFQMAYADYNGLMKPANDLLSRKASVYIYDIEVLSNTL